MEDATVIIVHDDADFLAQVTDTLQLAGYLTEIFTDPLKALDRLDLPNPAAMLITRISFAHGRPNGISLARMARHKRPGLKILFVARSEYRPHADDIGHYIETPVSPQEVAAFADRLLS